MRHGLSFLEKSRLNIFYECFLNAFKQFSHGKNRQILFILPTAEIEGN